LLYVLVVFVIVYFFPKGGKFAYEFQKGKPWQYETLVAPYSFSIKKPKELLQKEASTIRANNTPYFNKDTEAARLSQLEIESELNEVFSDSIAAKAALRLSINASLEALYTFGVLDEDLDYEDAKKIRIKSGSQITEVSFASLVQKKEIKDVVYKQLIQDSLFRFKDPVLSLIYNNLRADISFNSELTSTALEEQIQNIPEDYGVQEKGVKIIARGEIVEGLKWSKLRSLKANYESITVDEHKSNYLWIIIGYSVLVGLALLMLFLFLKKYRKRVYDNNTKVTFILFNITLMIVLTSLAVRYDVAYVYVVPLCILPLILKAFFDARLGLFAHVVAILIIGFIVPDSFEYVFLQIIAGVVTILTVSELHKRVNLFISVGQIVGLYILAYFAFFIIREGDISYLAKIVDTKTTVGETIRWNHVMRYLLCGVAMLFVQPLIYVYEKLFGLVSDVSLLELSDTNAKLLKQLENEAPGSFHHSLNVANLAEAAANEIGANTMLVRVGALYHDIGKIKNPMYFTENQRSSSSMHDGLDPAESAKIIINHVLHGIEIAKRNNLPDRVIDFIRTHHGTSTVYYFYKMAQEKNEQVRKEDFQYPGPKPFSKETAILMMCDSVEAASKSLKEPNAILIAEFVDKIITKQVSEGQFLNANITFKEIEIIKKVLKKKLNHIYHLRIEYPD
jgi:hypothetical protein